MNDELLRLIGEKKIIAIVRGVRPADIVGVGEALLAGGVSMMEVTYDHSGPGGIEATLESLSLIGGAFAGRLSYGVGTVLSAGQVVEAHRRGAGFIISPNVDEAVIARTKELGMLSMPGALTPTEIAAAWRMGADIVKLFPAGLWGVEYIKAVRAPLSHIPMAAVGGVEPGNIGDFLRAGVLCFGVGSNLVNAKKVAAGDFASITDAAEAFARKVAEAK